MEGLIYGGKFGFKIDWASLIVGSKLTVFALFYFVFEGNFPSTSPPYIWRGDFTEGFLRCRSGGLIFGEAYTWRGLFSKFYGISVPRRPRNSKDTIHISKFVILFHPPST